MQSSVLSPCRFYVYALLSHIYIYIILIFLHILSIVYSMIVITSCDAIQYMSRAQKSARLVAPATKFCAMVPNIFSVIIAFFPLRPVYKIYTSSHAASGKQVSP
jgi:hypothetical protein